MIPQAIRSPKMKEEILLVALSVPLILAIAIFSGSSSVWIVLPFLPIVGILVLVFQPTVSKFLALIFILIAWFPEFSQTEDAFTAADAPSIYNFRPVPAITASVFDCIFAAIVIFWLIKYVSPEPKEIFKVPLAKPVLAFLGVWFFSLLHGLFRGNEVYYAMREFRVGAYFVLTYLMVATVCTQTRQIEAFLKLALVMALIVGSYGVIRFFLGIGKELADVRIIYYDIADSMLLYIAMLIVAGLFYEGLLKGKYILTTAFILPIAFTFLFSYRRGAWVAFTCAMLFLMLFYPGRAWLRRRIIWRAAAVILLLGVLISSVPAVRNAGLDFVIARASSVFDVDEDSSNVFRILDAMNAFNAFTQHPIIGVGAGGRYDIEYASGEPEIMTFMDEVSRTSHVGYLYVLFKSGIIGFAAYMAIFGLFLKQWFGARANIADARTRALHMALGAIVVAFLVNNITEPVSDTLRPSMELAFALGWSAVWTDRIRRASSNNQREERFRPERA